MKRTHWLATPALALAAALLCAFPPSAATAAAGDPCTLDIYIRPDIEAGTIVWTNPDGPHYVGESVAMQATANAGYTFLNWTENGAVVSADAIYSFTVTTNRNLTANFQSYAGMTFAIGADAVPAAAPKSSCSS